ncbi:MAG TPA: hypothetical protein VFT29_17520, partial [Gemmatimonadaceae bacterium]|nr:hypothetical protein [Gemmatimonadaceae bacterium]
MTAIKQEPPALESTAPSAKAFGQTVDDPSWLDVLALFLHNRRRLVVLPLIGAVLAVGLTLVQRRTYTSSVSFTPAASPLPGGSLASLAGQFGVSISGDPGASPDFYASLLGTQELLQPIVLHRYSIPGGEPQSGTLIDLYEIDKGDYGKTLFEGIRFLRERVLTVSFDRRTGIVSLAVET